jgi:hypothetical protein
MTSNQNTRFISKDVQFKTVSPFVEQFKQIKEMYDAIATNPTITKCMRGEKPTETEIQSLALFIKLCRKACPDEYCDFVDAMYLNKQNIHTIPAGLELLGTKHLSLCHSGAVLARTLGVQNIITIYINRKTSDVVVRLSEDNPISNTNAGRGGHFRGTGRNNDAGRNHNNNNNNNNDSSRNNNDSSRNNNNNNNGKSRYHKKQDTPDDAGPDTSKLVEELKVVVTDAPKKETWAEQMDKTDQ